MRKWITFIIKLAEYIKLKYAGLMCDTLTYIILHTKLHPPYNLHLLIQLTI